MRIGLNGTAYDSLASGARDRFVHLYSEVARRSPGDELVVYSPRELSLVSLMDGPVADGGRTPLSPARPLPRFVRSGRWFRRRLARDGADLLVTDHFPVLARPPTLLTIHDLRYLVLEDAGSALRRLYFRTRFARDAARARAVVTVSETMREEILDRLRLDPDRVHVVPNGISPAFRRAPDEAVARVRASLGLPAEYLLTVGVLERRKNLPFLLRALARAGDVPPLVLAGRGGPEEANVRRAAAEAGLADRVMLLGYAAAPDLAALYTGASAVLMPSRYEGFGLPLLEAFACGTPVVSARAAALPEVAGGAALLCDPDDEEGFADAIRRVLEDGPLRGRLAEAGRARAAELTWEAAATRFLGVLDALRGVG